MDLVEMLYQLGDIFFCIGVIYNECNIYMQCLLLIFQYFLGLSVIKYCLLLFLYLVRYEKIII